MVVAKSERLSAHELRRTDNIKYASKECNFIGVMFEIKDKP
jgi:hypothetical protein